MISEDFLVLESEMAPQNKRHVNNRKDCLLFVLTPVWAHQPTASNSPLVIIVNLTSSFHCDEYSTVTSVFQSLEMVVTNDIQTPFQLVLERATEFKLLS